MLGFRFRGFDRRNKRVIYTKEKFSRLHLQLSTIQFESLSLEVIIFLICHGTVLLVGILL